MNSLKMDKGITKPLFAQHYNLKWTNYTNNILQMFAEQFSKESFTDITLACEGQYIKAHKMVLSACSPYFEEMLNMYLVPHPMVVMNGIKFTLLKILVEFMYHGEVKVADEDLSNLLELAEQLQVKGLCNVRNKDNNKDGENEPEPEESTGSNTNNRKRRRTSTTTVTEPLKNQNNSNQGHTNNEDNVKPVDKPKTDPNDKDEIKVTETKLIKTEKPSPTQTQRVIESKTPNKIYKVVSADTIQEPGIRMVPDYSHHNTLKIRRPQNAFMIFANEFRKQLASENPGESNKDISVRLGNMWKTLPSNVKSMYYSAAKKANDEHKTKYPGYYYSPKEARLRKEMKSSVFRKNKSMEALQMVQLVMGEGNEDTPQIVYNECGDPEYDEISFIHDIKEEEEEILNV